MFNWMGKNPIKAVLLSVFLIGFVGAGFKILGAAGSFMSQAVDVAAEEFNPKAMLRKYEWFKDASNSLDGMRNNIANAVTTIDGIREMYRDVPRKDWDRWDRQQLMQSIQELNGLRQIYNGLAAEYNSQSAKFNWRAFDKTEGDMPAKSYSQL